MRRWVGDGRGVQPVLLAVDVREELPADHLVWAVLQAVGELDLALFEAAYRADGRSRPPYDPRSILALIMYCAQKRMRSGQEIADACRDDLGARVIMGGGRPRASTINRFQDLHADAIRALLPQTLRLGQAEGLVDVGVVAGDGTKVVANAAMSRTVDQVSLQAQIGDLEASLQAAETAWAQAVAGRPGHPETFLPVFDDVPGDLAGGGARVDGEGAAWRRVGALARLLDSRRAALAWLGEHPPATALAEWQEKMTRDSARVDACTARMQALHATLQDAWDTRRADQEAGRVFVGTPMVPPDRHCLMGRARAGLDKATARADTTAAARAVATRVNTTDPASRVMPGKHDGFDQRYNLQALACPGQFILAVTLHDSPNDKQALTPLLAAARANLDAAGITARIGVSLHDSGYACEANFTADLPVDLLLVAVEKEARQAGRQPDRPSTTPPRWTAMADRLTEPDNANLYKRRAAIIEPLFAQLFARFARTLTTRGSDVLTELHLWAATHNILKIIRKRRTRPRPKLIPG
jgi:transposase